MKYYSKLNVPGAKILMAQAAAYARKTPRILGLQDRVHLIQVPLDEARAEMAALDIFSVLNLSVVHVFYYVIYGNSQTLPHIDSYHHAARINLPVMNCEKSFIQFWSGVSLQGIRNARGAEVQVAVPGTGRVVDRVELTDTTVMRVNEVHNSWMEDLTKTPRVSLSLGFDRCPSFLLE